MFSVMLVLGMTCVVAEPSDSPGEIFTRRIVPIVQSSRASSCTECHFGGVDLKQYVLDDAAQTFAALRGAGLVDVARPASSKLLTFINRRPAKEDAALAKVRAEEYAAFRSWIEAAARDPAILAVATPKQAVGPAVPVEVVRHARHDRVLQSFIDNIWVEVERCENCHSAVKNKAQVKKHGEHISWMKPGDPAATLATIIEHDLINVDEPDKSMILLKPLALVEHGGHIKFPVGGRTDQQYRRFLNDYAAIVKGQYQTATELPQSHEYTLTTGQHLRITDLPPEWKGRLIRVDVWNWFEFRTGVHVAVGTADGRIGDKSQWQNLVYAVEHPNFGTKRSSSPKPLPAGEYRAHVYVDLAQRVEKNRDAVLDESDLVGTIRFNGAWPPGYSPPKILSVKDFEKR